MDRRSFLRAKLSGTSTTITILRYGIDQVNRVIQRAQRPVRQLLDRVGQEASWFYYLGGSGLCMMIPAVVYPYLGDILTPDKRRIQEEDRVRRAVQRGDDPHPYLKHRENIHGITMPWKAVDETQVPTAAADEFRVMSHYRDKVQREAKAKADAEFAAIAELEARAAAASEANQGGQPPMGGTPPKKSSWW